MPITKTNESFPQAYLQKAGAFLQKENFSEFLQTMALLGEWVQKKFGITQYTGNEENFSRELQAACSSQPGLIGQLNSLQALAFTVFQNAWQDKGLARVNSISFANTADVVMVANSCLFVKQDTKPFWQIIPVNAQGEKLNPLAVTALEDVDELAKRLSPSLIGKSKQHYTADEKILVERLLKAVRRATLKTLDQKILAAKAELAKDFRHRVKLGLEAFNRIYNPAQESEVMAPQERPNGNEEKARPATEKNQLHLKILDTEPSSELVAQFSPNTYVIIRPRNERAGRIYFYKTNKNRKQEIKDAKLKKALQGDQPIFLSDKIPFLKKAPILSDERLETLVLTYHCRHLDEEAVKAIRHYQTRSQKITKLIGNILAALTAFAYGTVELVATMVGFFVAAGVVWSNPGLALAGALLLAGAVIFPIPSTWANWKVFSTYVPEFFNKIRAEYQDIPTKGKKALFWGLSLFALATGMAAGGLAYTATIALPGLMGLGAAVGFIFPPIGVALALAIVLSQTFMLVRNFAHILRKENSWKAFKKPFQQVGKVLNDTQASRAKRLAVWCMVGGLTILSVLGLMMSCFTSTRSVGKLFIDQLKTAPEKALILGIVISGIGSFFSRVYFTLNSAITSAIILCKRFFKLVMPGEKLHPIPSKKIIGILTDSAVAGAFYAENMLRLSQQSPQEVSQDIDLHLSGMAPGPAAFLTLGAFLSSFIRYITIDFNYAGKPEHPHKPALKKAAAARVENNVTFFFRNCSPPATLNICDYSSSPSLRGCEALSRGNPETPASSHGSPQPNTPRPRDDGGASSYLFPNKQKLPLHRP